MFGHRLMTIGEIPLFQVEASKMIQHSGKAQLVTAIKDDLKVTKNNRNLNRLQFRFASALLKGFGRMILTLRKHCISPLLDSSRLGC